MEENKELVEMAVKKNKEIEKANDEWEYLTGDEELKRLEFLELKKCLDDNSIKAAIKEEAWNEGIEAGIKEGKKRGIKQGLKQGVEQGIEKGIKQGIEQGIEQGEKNRTIEIAKKMLKQNIPIETIVKITELSEEELKKLI